MKAAEKILIVFGTRPEAIKLAPVLIALREQLETFQTIICVAAQHREMCDQVLNLFEISPHYDLDLMRPNQDPLQITEAALEKLRKVYEIEKPDWVLVQGDTTTAMTAALVAYHLKIKIAHVEAGLRTGEKFSPFPEEMNRRLISVLADLHFAPTSLAKENLLREGISSSQIFITGNTAIDALQIMTKKLEDPKISSQIQEELKKLGIRPNQDFILITAHRRESFGEGIKKICRALVSLAAEYPQLQFIYPVHRNPEVIDPIQDYLGNSPNILLTEPLNYLQLVALMQKSLLILTDSGGIQEEAPSLGKKVLVMRDHTERQEGLQAGCSILVGREVSSILRAFKETIDSLDLYQPPPNPYGNGKAAEQIVETLKKKGTSREGDDLPISSLAANIYKN